MTTYVHINKKSTLRVIFSYKYWCHYVKASQPTSAKCTYIHCLRPVLALLTYCVSILCAVLKSIRPGCPSGGISAFYIHKISDLTLCLAGITCRRPSLIPAYIRPADSKSVGKLVRGLKTPFSHPTSPLIIAGNFNVRLNRPNLGRTTAFLDTLADHG